MAPKREAIALAQQQIAELSSAIETYESELSAIEAKSSELSALEVALTAQLQGLNLASSVVSATVEAQLLATLGVASEPTAPAMARAPRESKDSLIERVASELDATHKSVKLLAEKLDKSPAQVAGALDALVLAGKADKVKQEGSRAFLYFKKA